MGDERETTGTERRTVEFVHRRLFHPSERIRLEVHDLDDHIARVIQAVGDFYEENLLRYLDMALPGQRGLAVDAGANIGNHAIFFARYLVDHVVAVEPNPAVVGVLERNLRRNAPDGSWTVVGAAVGARAGRGRVVLPEDAGANIGMARVVPEGAAPEGSPGVTSTTVDAVLSETYRQMPDAGPVRLVKVDVEGMEAEVLIGARATLQRFTPEVLVETITPDDRLRIESILGPLGYAAVCSHGATPLVHYSHESSLRLRILARIHPWVAAVRRKVLRQ